MAEESNNNERKRIQVKHDRPMLPPEEGYTEEDILAFDRRLRGSVGEKDPLQYTVQPKIQGIAVQITYEAGALSLATTMGNGYEGEIVTANIKTILTVPLTLWLIGDAPPFPELLEVRGDVYMETEALEALNRSRTEKGIAPFKNAKEAAEDSLRQDNPRITAKRPLNMFCFDVGEVRAPRPETSHEMMVILQSWGFRVNRPHIRICSNPDELIEGCRVVREKQREFPFPMEGALIQVNRLDLPARRGSQDPAPPRDFVYKF
jgi:DNA ligase (NAD+)